MGISSLTYKSTVNSAINAANNATPTAAGGQFSNSYPSKSLSIGTAAADNAAGGGDEAFLFILTAAGSGNASVDLTSITDVMGTASVTLARVKQFRIQLLSAADDAVNGTACTSVTVGDSGTNDFISQSLSGWVTAAAAKVDLPNGSYVEFGTPSAGGVVVDSTHKIIYVLNNDSGHTMAVQFTGAGGDS